MRTSTTLLHGPLAFAIGSGALQVGRDMQPMLPSNAMFYDGAKLRHRLDQDGYLYFKNLVPRTAINKALDDVATQMVASKWTLPEDRQVQAERHGFALGVPFPSTGGDALPDPSFALTDDIKLATCGPTIMSLTRQVFGGGVHLLPHHTIDFSHPGEQHGFRMGSVFMNRGTKLALIAWVPMHDTPLNMGGLCVVRGSNSAPQYAKIRETYGAMDVEGSGIAGDGSFTLDPNELLPIGKASALVGDGGRTGIVDDTPLVTTTFEAGDVVLMTVYTMYGYMTNASDCWRISSESRWIMEGDDVGPDPRYWGSDPPGLSAWMEERHDPVRYPKSMMEAKKAWGLVQGPVTAASP